MENIYDKLLNYKTKHNHGFINSEIEDLIKGTDITIEDINNQLIGCTYMIDDDDEMITYNVDIYHALRNIIRNK